MARKRIIAAIIATAALIGAGAATAAGTGAAASASGPCTTCTWYHG